jgi:hypothetical protein
MVSTDAFLLALSGEYKKSKSGKDRKDVSKRLRIAGTSCWLADRSTGFTVSAMRLGLADILVVPLLGMKL